MEFDAQVQVVAPQPQAFVAAPPQPPPFVPRAAIVSDNHGTWSAEKFATLGPPMPAQVDDAAYAVFRDCLYVVGGIDVNGDRLDTVFIFDGAQWTTGPKLPYAISCATAAVHDGTIILFHHHQQGDTDRKFARRRIELRGGTWVLRDETTRPALTDQLHLPIICANVLLG